MSKLIRARTDGETLLYADGDEIVTMPIIAWDVSCDPPAPITPIGSFYPGKRFAAMWGMSLIMMPQRVVTRSRAVAEAYLLGR